MFRIVYPISFLLAVIIAVGCSNVGETPIAPYNANFKDVDGDTPSNRVLWGIWDITLDPSGLKATAIPERDIQLHYNITDMLIPPACDNCLDIHVNSFDPVTRIMDVDAILRNPFDISGHDIRGMLFTNDAGHELVNPDDWIGLWDIPGSGNINPFKAFAKDEPNRIFAAKAQHVENYLVLIPVPPQLASIKYAVDASWPGNCKEPYSIQDFAQFGPLYNTPGSQAPLMVNVYDWQSDVSEVTLIAPEITGEDSTQFNHEYEELWTLMVTNDTGAPPGDYKVMLSAKSSGAPTIPLYDYAIITITEAGPTNPFDVTPPWLNFAPQALCATDQGRLYIAAGVNGVHTFNILDSENPFWTSQLPSYDASDITTDGNYLYVIDSLLGLAILDISMPDWPYILNIVGIPGSPCCVTVSGGYAYVGDLSNGLQIIDIDPPESANIVKTVDFGGSTPLGVSVDAGYAYVASASDGLKIVDIDPPESAYIVNTVAMNGSAVDVLAQFGYAYVCAESGGFHIVDVDPPETASVINTVPTDDTVCVAASGNQAYVGDAWYSLYIIDISTPGSESILKKIGPPCTPGGLVVMGGYAYLGDTISGLEIFDVDPIPDAAFIKLVPTPGNAKQVLADGDWAYITDHEGGLMIANIAFPFFASIYKAVDTYNALGLDVSGGYAYVADGSRGLQVIDIDPPDTASIAHTVVTISTFYNVSLGGLFAYTVSSPDGFQVIDIDPPDSAHIINTLATNADSLDIEVVGGYAYVANTTDGLIVINLDPPGSETIAKTVSITGGATSVDVDGGYAYVTSSSNLHIIDIEPLSGASIVNTITTPDLADDVTVSNGYAYVADDTAGLQMIDVEPIDSAYIISSVPTLKRAVGVDVQGNFAFVADSEGGLRIIQLW